MPPPDEPSPAGPARWRIPRRVVAVKATGAVILAAVAGYPAAFGGDRLQVVVAGAAAVGLGVFALRDLVAPVRLAADADGVTVVAGFARRVRLPWSAVEAVRVDVRSRYGLRSEQLEVDAGAALYVFRPSDLGAPVADVARTLAVLRSTAAR